MKKFLSVILTMSMVLSLAVIPAHASGTGASGGGAATSGHTSGFSSANILGGTSQVRGEFKGSHGGSDDEYYTRSQSGTGANRVITETMKKQWKKQYALMESGIADPLSGTGYDSVHFAHARIKIALKKVNNEVVTLKLFPVQSDWVKEGDGNSSKAIFSLVYNNAYSTYGWMSTNGKDKSGVPYGVSEYDRCHIYTSTDENDRTVDYYEGRNFLRWGSTDTPDYQTFDFIFDCYKGYVYGYVDGRLIATKINATHFDNFYGYTICGSAEDNSFANGTKLWFSYDTERPGETLYVDTDDYTVRLEDVLVDAGLASKNSDPCNIMESDHIADYVFAGDTDYNYYDSYERRDSNGNPVSITTEKVKTGTGNVTQLYGGCYYKGNDWPGYAKGKGVIHVSFDQKINTTLNSGSNAASTGYSFRVASEGGKFYQLLSMAAASGNKLKVTLEAQQGSGNPSLVLDKDFNDAIHYDIILYGKHYSTDPETATAEAVGYYFADGRYLGSYTINRGANAETAGTDIWWTPTQLVLYSDNTANVTYSNYKIALYDEFKNPEDIVVALDSSQKGWSNTSVDMGEGVYADTFTVSGRIAAGEDAVPSGAKAYIGVYDAENMLLDCDSIAYTEGVMTSKRFQMSCDGEIPSYAKLLLWNGQEPVVAEKKILFRTDPMTYFAEVSYDGGMIWKKLDYRVDNSDITEYSYPVADREILTGTIRTFDNIYIDTSGNYAGALIKVEDTVFDTVTLTKGVDYMGYTFLAAKPEVFKYGKTKFPNGISPTYAAGYTRVIYTDDQEVTLTVPDNAKYLYLYNNGKSDDTGEYENCIPSAVTFSKSGNTQNTNKLRIATWNIGHFSLGDVTYSTISSLGFSAKDYKDYIDAIDADVVSLNEYSAEFTSGVLARNAIFGDYPTVFEGEQNRYSCNALYARSGLLTNMQVHYFDCYATASGGSSVDKPTDHYYITSDLNLNGETVKFVNAHLLYEDNPQTLAINAINELISVFSAYDKVIILGDCNVTYDKFQYFINAGYEVAQTDSRLATYGPCQGSKYNTDIAEGYGSYDNIIYKGVTVSNFGLAGCKLSDHYAIYCDIE